VCHIDPVVGAHAVLDFADKPPSVPHALGNLAHACLAESGNLPTDALQHLALKPTKTASHRSCPICCARHIGIDEARRYRPSAALSRAAALAFRAVADKRKS
jgi:hypothetical protein